MFGNQEAADPAAVAAGRQAEDRQQRQGDAEQFASARPGSGLAAALGS